MSQTHDTARRTLLKGAAAATAVAAVRGRGGPARKGDPIGEPTLQLAELSAVEAVARMSRGELRAERYAQALLARCQAAHALNAFITLEPERVLEDARARDRERQAGARPGSCSA